MNKTPKLEYRIHRPYFKEYSGSQIVFDSPVIELVKFADVMLALLENRKMFISSDGKTWQQFIFEILPGIEKETK